MVRYKCNIHVQNGDELIFWVSSNSTWKMLDPAGWCPIEGDWNASDLIGQGGCVCYGAGERHPPTFRLDEFKPFGYQVYNCGTVGEGTGRFLEPTMDIGPNKEFKWEILDVVQEE
jgi:hypothetical protein